MHGTNQIDHYSSGVHVTVDCYYDGGIIQDHLFNNLGRIQGTFQHFNSPTDFGCHFIQKSTNELGTNSFQYHEITMGLGSAYVSKTCCYDLRLA